MPTDFPEAREVNVEEILREGVPEINTQRALSTNPILVRNSKDSLIDTVDLDNYADVGKAIDDAIQKLPQYGDSNTRNGTIVLPNLNDVEFSHEIPVYEHLTIEGQGERSTVLTYTGSESALKDEQIRASGTNELTLRNFRIDAPNGKALNLFQPNRLELINFESRGNSNDGTKGIELHTGSAQVNNLYARNMRIYDYEVNFDHVDDTGDGQEIVLGTFIDCVNQTSHSSGIAYRGSFSGCTWVHNYTHQAQTACMKFYDGSGRNTIINAMIDGPAGTDIGIDASAMSADSDKINVLSSRLNANNPIKDPNDVVNFVDLIQAANDGLKSNFKNATGFREPPKVFRSNAPIIPEYLETFEKQDFSYYSGSTGDFNWETSIVYEGSVALEKPGGASAGIATDEFNIERGKTYIVPVALDWDLGADDTHGTYFLSSDDSWVGSYAAELSGDNQTFTIYKKGTDGTISLVTQKNVSISNNTYYIVEFTALDNGLIIVELKDTSNNTKAVATMNDTQFDGSHIIFRPNNVNRAYWDSIRQKKFEGKTISEIEGGAVSIDTVGRQAITVSHGLGIAPKIRDIDVQLVKETATDWNGYIMNIKNIDSTSFDVIVYIDTPSATSGATSDLQWEIDI